MLLTLLVSLIWVSRHVTGSYEVEVTVHSYRNPSGRCDECRSPDNPLLPRCCDEATVRPRDVMCPETCDTTMTICIRPLGETGISCDSQLDHLFVTGRSVETDTNSLNFGSDFFGLSNPSGLSNAQAWRGTQFLFTSVDCTRLQDSSESCATTDRIDSFTVDINITVGTASPETQYTGNAGLALLNVSFEVRCHRNFYGQDCLTTCSNFRSCAGCGLPGFTGEFCQYIDHCAEERCNGHGDCTNEIDGFTCDCDSGFNGDSCQYNINECDGVSCNYGECIDQINGFTCDCESGFTGETCEFDIDDCEDVDCNNGECVDEVNSFMCSCEDGFMGEACAETDRCFSVTCSGKGQCVNSPEEQFTCVCDPGYTGRQCQEELTSTGNSASSSAGGIVGGVLGALIAVILVAIIVVVVSIRNRSHGHTSDQSAAEDIFPEDNPAYGQSRVSTRIEVETNGVTDRYTTLRDFENPLYPGNTVADPDVGADARYSIPNPIDSETEDHYTLPDSVAVETEDHYTLPDYEDNYAVVPDSVPCNIYDTVRERGEGVDNNADFEVYSVIK